jgi:methylmalonyl-CoA mutase N-terminal domain/subunit
VLKGVKSNTITPEKNYLPVYSRKVFSKPIPSRRISMNKPERTKQILENKWDKNKKRSLYDGSTLEKIKVKYSSLSAGKDWRIKPNTILGSGIPRSLLYTPVDVPNLNYDEDLGFPGEEPYTRGIHQDMYRGREFTIRQLCGFGGPEDTNQRIKFLLDHGATGSNVVFDFPTIQGYDSDDDKARGQVGLGGVAVDSVQDMEILFKDVPIDKISVSLVTHYPTNTAILFSMYLAMAERRGIPWEKLTGSVQNDFVMEEVVRGAPEFIPPRDCFKIQCDNIEFIRQNSPRWNYITLNGYNLREAGTSAVTETAVAMVNAIETISTLAGRGHDVDRVAERITYFWDISSDFFEEIARLRAARRLWYRIMKFRFHATKPRSMWMRCHVQTSGLSLARGETRDNIVRAAYQALAAILGGTQSLHVDSYDEPYSVPTETASLVSLITQKIIQDEIAVTSVVDPLGGSFYIESLTDEIENRILDEIDEIENMGGIITAVETGWLHNRIIKYAQLENEMIERGKIKIAKPDYPEKYMIEPFHYPEGTADRQHHKLVELKNKRDNERVNTCLQALHNACKKGENLVPFCLEAAKANATKGEISRVFKESFGAWKPPTL